MSDVPAPAINQWDVAAVTTEALSVLRLGASDVDADRVAQAAAAAIDLLDQNVDAVEPFDAGTLAALQQAAVQVTIELYRRKDAPFGVYNAWTADEASVRIARDPLAGVRRLILPWKQRWGVA